MRKGIGSLFFSITGRITRSQFWLGMIVSWLVFLAVVVVAPLAIAKAGQIHAPTMAAIDGIMVLVMAALALLIPFCAVQLALIVKRFHDLNESGWWAVLLAVAAAILVEGSVLLQQRPRLALQRGNAALVDVPTFIYVILAVAGLVAVWLILRLAFARGTHGPNDYGSESSRQSASTPGDSA